MSGRFASSPVGSLVAIRDGVHAFVPDALPRELLLSSRVVARLDVATRAAATLGGVGETLPNPHLLIRPFVSREAVLSSKIEGTQTLMSDLFLFEASNEATDRYGDAQEVANYVLALTDGIRLLAEVPLSVRLLNQIHGVLMRHARGADKRPGELRDRQVYIGSAAAGIEQAMFVPPPAERVRDLLTDLERFLNEDLDMPLLVQCALVHYQFETIHPYLDGNGRLGRLLIVLFLCAKGMMPQPLLYLSAYLEAHRSEYYQQLDDVRATGDWNAWLAFFLTGVGEQAHDALLRSRRVLDLHRMYVERLRVTKASARTFMLLDLLFEHPFMTASFASKLLGVTDAGVRRILERLVRAGILEVLPGHWPTVFAAQELLRAIEAPTMTPDAKPRA